MAEDKNLVIVDNNREIQNMLYTFRGKQVMIDSDLAMLYQVETKVFNQAVKRNLNRFPESFRFQLTEEEYENLRSQIVTSSFHILLPLIGNENVLGIYLNFFLLLDSTL